MIEEFEKHDDRYCDTALIGLVGSAFDEGRRGRDTQDVLARGRALRRRRRAVPALSALAVVAASVSLAVALTGQSGASGTAGAAGAGAGHSLAANGSAVNVDNAAFSVHTDAKTGKVTVTLKQTVDEGELQQILAKAGIRTYFSATTVTRRPGQAVPISTCTYLGATPLASTDAASVMYPTPGSAKTTITIDPSKLPSGSVLAFRFEYIAHDTAFVSMEVLSGEPTGCIATPMTAGSKVQATGK